MLNKNKKYFFVFYLIYFVFNFSLAQTKKDSLVAKYEAKRNHGQNYFSISVGVAVPISGFSNNSITNTASGYAITGVNVDACCAKILKNGIGFAIMYKYLNNAVNNGSITSQYSQQYPNITWDVQTSSWKLNSFFAGLYYSYKINKIEGLYFDTKILAGYAYSTSPQFTITRYQGSTSASSTQEAKQGGSFAFCAGLGLSYCPIGNGVALILNSNYFRTAATYNNVAITNSSGSISTQNLSQTITAINVTLGLAYTF